MVSSTHPSQALRGVERILYVDPDPLACALAQNGLEGLGYSVTLANGGQEALTEVRNDLRHFDAVVFELFLADMPGMDLAHRLRHLRRDLPLIVMTDLHLRGESLLGTHAEVTDLLHRPYALPELAACLRKHLTQVQSSEAQDPKRAHILLAEDSHVTRTMVRKWLVQEGHRVVEAKDGEEAWQAFHEGAFDLLITDVVMPAMDGLELSRRVRSSDAAIPIAVMTTAEDRETLKSALHVGANDFLNKPFDKELLLACVSNLLSDTGQRATVRRTAETAQAVRQAQRALQAVAEQDLPLYSLYAPLTDAGGDVLRASRLPDGRIFFALGDVAGHSVISSYAVAAFLGMLTSFDLGNLELSTIAHRLNMGIQEGPFSEVPVCTLLGIWNPRIGRLQLLNAGIPHGCLCRAADRSAKPIPLNGTPLGILADPIMDETVVWLHPGDRVLFGSDGFFEVTSPQKALFETEVPSRWNDLLDLPIQKALGEISEAARNHAAGSLVDDLLVMAFEQSSPTLQPEEFLLSIQSLASEIDHAVQEFKTFFDSSEKGRTYSDSRRFELGLALREALTNAVFHGNQNQSERRVVVHARFEGNTSRLRLRVADEGAGFPFDRHEPSQDITSERGRGIPLMRHLAQHVCMTGSELSLSFDPEDPSHDKAPTHL